MIFSIISLFPEMFNSLTQYGITARAFKQKIYQLATYNPRDFVNSNYRRIDDTPFGGGHGMIMQVEPLELAINAAKVELESTYHVHNPRRIFLSPQGIPANQQLINTIATEAGIIFVCGRYEGVDERFISRNIDLEVATGDIVVSGGELPAMLLMDAIIRRLPGTLDDIAATIDESFSVNNGLLDYPQYSKPRDYHGFSVPDVLLSGNHEQIARWRLQMSLWHTYQKRPDLLKQRQLTTLETQLLNEMLFKNAE